MAKKSPGAILQPLPTTNRAISTFLSRFIVFCNSIDNQSYPTGNVSKVIGLLKIGDTIKVKGPKGQMMYRPGLVRELGMIAGGTGITPMLQIIRAILKNKSDKTKISLIFANVNEEDILLRKELEQLAKEESSRFKLYFVLNNPPQEGWDGGVGFVTEDMIKKHCPKSANDIKILLCGPPPMISAMKKNCVVCFSSVSI